MVSGELKAFADEVVNRFREEVRVMVREELRKQAPRARRRRGPLPEVAPEVMARLELELRRRGFE